jgi:amidohydrolase
MSDRYDALKAFRQELHRHPELSGREYRTMEKIMEKVMAYGPDRVVKLGETGIAFVFLGKEEGPTIMFRAELDALPIAEESMLPYRSVEEGKGHLCGHDGHMTILVGLAERIASQKAQKGRVILLFQPAEETGQGAVEVLHSPAFDELRADYIFALHNVPDFPLGQVILRKGHFSAASRGLTVKLKGKTAHAAHPEQALSPVNAIARIINELERINQNNTSFETLSFATVIHVQAGEIAFGTTPGYGEIRLTLRSFSDRDMDFLVRAIEGLLQQVAMEEKLLLDFTYSEIFPTIQNDDAAVELIEEVAIENKMATRYQKEPFRWSEDFGYFSQIMPAGFFGLGAGHGYPALHHPDYDFPDEILLPAIDLFYSIYQKLLN